MAQKLPRFMIMIIAFIATFGGGVAGANELDRPKTIAELGRVQADEFYRIADAEVAWVNYPAMRRDFPSLRDKSDEWIRNWILDNYAVMSKEQLRLNGIRHTPIRVNPKNRKPVRGYRPHGYIRAAVFETGFAEGGLIDLKGVGHPSGSESVLDQIVEFKKAKGKPARLNELRISHHSDGVASFGEVIAEGSRQQAVQMLSDIRNAKMGTNFQTVETYFKIALRSRILKDGDNTVAMAIVGRQANVGRETGLAVPPGIYSDPSGGYQTTRSGTAIDFGGVRVEDPRLQGNFGILDDFPGRDSMNPGHWKPWSWGSATGDAFLAGDKGAVTRHMNEMLAPIMDEWKALPVAKELEAFATPRIASAPVVKPAPIAEPVAKPAPIAEPVVKPAPIAEPVVKPAPIAEPVVKPAPIAEPVVKPAPIAEPAVKPAPIAEPAVKPAPIAEPAVKPAPKPASITTPVVKPTAVTEPVANVAKPAAQGRLRCAWSKFMDLLKTPLW